MPPNAGTVHQRPGASRFQIGHHDEVHEDAEDASGDAWKPAQWDLWSHKRRTLWRRERQAELAERLEPASDEERASRDRVVEHLKAEAAELRRELDSEGDGEPTS
jgi:hypothetical protein